HPLPLLRRNWGTVSSNVAVQITRVFPSSIRHEPSAVEMKSGTMFTGRICSGERLSERKTIRGDCTFRAKPDGSNPRSHTATPARVIDSARPQTRMGPSPENRPKPLVPGGSRNPLFGECDEQALLHGHPYVRADGDCGGRAEPNYNNGPVWRVTYVHIN